MIYACKIEKDKDMGYVASFPDLPNVNAFGASLGDGKRSHGWRF